MQPAVKHSARAALESLVQEVNESDHELEEILGPVQEEVRSDDNISDQEDARNQEDAPKTNPSSFKSRNKKKYRAKRAETRLSIQKDQGTTLKAISLKKRSASRAKGVHSSTSYEEDFTPSNPGWKAMPDIEKDQKEYSLEELVDTFNMKVIDWDGR